MSRKVFIVGRNPNVSGNEIPIQVSDPSNKISGNHCRITYEDGVYWIEDLISTNGTFVDGTKINSKTQVDSSNIIKCGGDYIFSLSHPSIQNNTATERIAKRYKTHEYTIKNQQSGKDYNFSLNTGSKFFTFINPFIKYIDSGKFYKNPTYWLYTILAIFQLAIPILFMATSSLFSEYVSARDIFALLLLFLIICFNSWVCFQVLWNRRRQLEDNHNHSTRYQATAVVADIVKTYGEVVGISLGLIGFGISLISLLFYSWDDGARSVFKNSSSYIYSFFKGFDIFPLYDFFGIGNISLLGILFYPIYGFLIILFFKWMSELIIVLSNIANNTNK